MSIEDRVVSTAIERWTSSELECAICPRQFGFNGYVRVPEHTRGAKWAGLHLNDAGPEISHGPDQYGWIGIATVEDNGYWDAEALRGFSRDVVEFNAVSARAAFNSGSGRRWTMSDLRSAVEAIAKAVARLSAPGGAV